MRMIYAIQHNVTKRIYVGYTEKGNRIETHIERLRQGTHPVPLMQSDFDQYGFDYSAYILESATLRNWSDLERKWMHYFNTGDPQYGYNYMDKKAQKRDVSLFKTYSFEEWERMSINWANVSKKSFAKEVKERLASTKQSVSELAIKANVPADRIRGFFQDCRNITQVEMMRIGKALSFGVETWKQRE